MNQHLQTLAKYPEFYALKEELIKFCEVMTSELSDLDTTDPTFGFQAGVKVESVKQVKGLLTKLGLVTTPDLNRKKKTYE